MRYRWAGHGHGHHHATRDVAIAIVLAVLLLMLLAPRAHGAKGMEVAVQDDTVFQNALGYSTRNQALSYSRDIGATWMRVNVGWASSLIPEHRNASKPPKNPQYDWRRFDDLIVAASYWGIKPQFNLNGPAPRWATGNGKEGANRPKAKYYRGFVAAAVKHFKGRIARYSVWNEPNYVGWIAPTKSSGRIYRQLYLAAYKQIRKGDPKAKIFIGETVPYHIGSKRKTNAIAPLVFLRQMTCSNKSFTKRKCAGLKADGYAHHPYDFTHRPTYKYPGKDNATLATLGNLTRALDRMHRSGALRGPRGRKLDLYLTEYGFFRQGKRGISEEKRRKWLVQGFEIARKNKRVKQLLQYLIIEPGTGYKFFDTSLITEGGARTPTFEALKSWAQKALKRGHIKRQPAVNPIVFQNPGPGGAPAPPSGGGSPEPQPAPPPGSPPPPTNPEPNPTPPTEPTDPPPPDPAPEPPDECQLVIICTPPPFWQSP